MLIIAQYLHVKMINEIDSHENITSKDKANKLYSAWCKLV